MTPEQLVKIFDGVGGLIPSLGIKVDTNSNRFPCTMKIDEKKLTVPPLAHGGAICSLMDTSMGMLALKTSFEQNMAASTVELKVNFISPAKLGEEIVATASMQSQGKSLLIISGEAHEKVTMRKVAFAVGTFNMYDIDKDSETLKALGVFHRANL